MKKYFSRDIVEIVDLVKLKKSDTPLTWPSTSERRRDVCEQEYGASRDARGGGGEGEMNAIKREAGTKTHGILTKN